MTGEIGYSTLERRWARPTFDVHGLLGGYQGEGGKTIIPAWAAAKISFRLVPDQDPQTVGQQLRTFVEAHTPPGSRSRSSTCTEEKRGGRPRISRFMKGAAQAVEEGFGKPPVLIREGGSIPIVAQMVEVLGCDVLLMGMAG